MCELFGLSCNRKDRATLSLALFSRHSDENWHGWGIGYYRGNKARIIKRAGKARASGRFWQAVEEARSSVIIAHLRLASKHQSGICDRDCHPFVYPYRGRDWIFAHNGTLDINYESRLESDIDSARAFTFLMDRVEEYLGGGKIRGVYPAVVKATRNLLELFDGTLNYLLSDGNLLFAFCNHRQMYLLRREKDYGGACLVCTQKLTDESWVEIPRNRVLVVSRGEVVVLGEGKSGCTKRVEGERI